MWCLRYSGRKISYPFDSSVRATALSNRGLTARANHSEGLVSHFPSLGIATAFLSAAVAQVCKHNTQTRWILPVRSVEIPPASRDLTLVEDFRMAGQVVLFGVTTDKADGRYALQDEQIRAPRGYGVSGGRHRKKNGTVDLC